MKRKTKQDFLRQARLKHGDKYDYSKVEYKNSTTKVCIICLEHGEFWQTPKLHLNGCGCPACGHIKTNEFNRSDTKEFIKKAIQIHGERYDYSKVEYKSNNKKVCLICPEHGEFYITPANHLEGQGCSKCGHKKQGAGRIIPKEEILKRFAAVHGDKYDYSKVNYVNTQIKIKIICPEHGEFWQTPEKHFNGNGCPKCAGNLKLTKNEFLQRANEKHGGKYKYNKVEYVNTDNKVCIICPEHGEFWQRPSDHFQGRGCPKCVGKNKTTEDFVKECKKIHGDKYDYSEVEYHGAFTKVKLVCCEKDNNGCNHGEFFVTPHQILSGGGCPKCGRSRSIQKQKKTFERFKEEVEVIYGQGIIDFSRVVYVNAHTPITISTEYLGEITVTPNKLLSRKYYKILKESYLAHRVRLFLQENKINFITEKCFNGTKC